MKAGLLLASYCLLASFPPAAIQPSIPSPSVPDGIGVNTHFTDPLPGEMEMITAAGFRWVRMDLPWQATKHEAGRYDFSAKALIGPGTSTIDMPYLDTCFRQGVLEDWDAVSVHPYRHLGRLSIHQAHCHRPRR